MIGESEFELFVRVTRTGIRVTVPAAFEVRFSKADEIYSLPCPRGRRNRQLMTDENAGGEDDNDAGDEDDENPEMSVATVATPTPPGKPTKAMERVTRTEARRAPTARRQGWNSRR